MQMHNVGNFLGGWWEAVQISVSSGTTAVSKVLPLGIPWLPEVGTVADIDSVAPEPGLLHAIWFLIKPH